MRGPPSLKTRISATCCDTLAHEFFNGMNIMYYDTFGFLMHGSATLTIETSTEGGVPQTKTYFPSMPVL